jgi:Family of unknown function (DUF6328)
VPTDRAEELEARGDREEAEERRDRQVMEVLQELRVAITGGQILFGFLLTVPFTQRWGDTDDFQRVLFLVTLLAVASATGFFIAPTSVHRIRFHQRDRSFLVGYANVMAIAGLACLSVAMLSAVLLITDVVFSRGTAVVATVALAVVLLVTWFAVPVARYLSDR